MIERCVECGFDGSLWTDADAIEAVAGLPERWRTAVAGLDRAQIERRPVARMWSIGEYTIHVRESVFGMRFGLDLALAGHAPIDKPDEPDFNPEPKRVDLDRALREFESEVTELCRRLRELAPERWGASINLGGDEIDVHWMVRHTLHDVTHHLGDVDRLRACVE